MKDRFRTSSLMLTVFILGWIVIVFMSSLKKSPAIDEVPHFGAGYSYLMRGDFRMNPEHPPLIKVLSLIPVWLIDRIPLKTEGVNYTVRSWRHSLQAEFGYHVLYRSAELPQNLMLHARFVPMLIGLLGGWVLYQWGKVFGGAKGKTIGLLSAVLLLTYPEYAGHARLLTFDVPTAVMCGIISLFAWKWFSKRSFKYLLLYALMIAVGSQVKLPVTVFSCFSFLTVICVGLVFKRLKRTQILSAALIISLFIYAACWMASGLRFSAVSNFNDLEAMSVYIPKDGNYGAGIFGRVLTFIWEYRLLPETSLAQLAHVRSFEGRTYFLLGELRSKPTPLYYFITFGLKTTLLLFVLMIFSIGYIIFKLIKNNQFGPLKMKLQLLKIFILVTPFLSLLVVFLFGNTNIGHRNILFIYLPICFIVSYCIVSALSGIRYRIAFYYLIGIIAILNFLTSYPNYETYFNIIGKSPYNAMKYLGDSNIDWGTDVPLLGDYMKAHYPNKKYNVALFFLGKPEVYGVSGYNWILSNYPYAINQPPIPDKASLLSPTAVSLNTMISIKEMCPKLVKSEPEWVSNSVAVFPPVIKGK